MIRTENLTYSHPGNIVGITAIDLQIEPRTQVAILGANGSGKSTLARCLNGIHVPQGGRVLVDDLAVGDPNSTYEIRRRVGMVFQNPDDQLVSTSVETEIAFGLENLSLPRPVMRQRIEEVLQFFHLTGFRGRHPHNLSGGEKQRVAIAAVVALRPRYLILDEPTSLLDPKSKVDINALLTRLTHEYGIACIQITQDPREAVDADRVLILHQGRLISAGSPTEIFSNPLLHQFGLDVPFTVALGNRLSALMPFTREPYLHLDELVVDLAPICKTQPPVPHLTEKNPTQAPAVLRTEELCYSYERGLPTERLAIAGITVEIPRGSILGLVGPSGAGKTTLAQHFNALLEPSSGRVILDGNDIWDVSTDKTAVRRQVGFAFQFPEFQLFDETVEDDVGFGPRNLGFPTAEVDKVVEEALDAVGLPLSVFGKRSPFSLSGGEMRRVAIAGILAATPEVLVLDEPTAGLDPRGAQQIRDIMTRLNGMGHTIILISHDMDLVAKLSSRTIVLNRRKLAIGGSTRSLLTDLELLKSTGLDAPEPTKLMYALRAAGCNVPTQLLTLEEVAQYIEGLQ